jgi:hypothetical protein
MTKKAIKLICIAVAAIVLLGVLLYFVPYTEKADFTLQGTVYKLERQEDPDSEETAPCTIRFEGQIRHYLFKKSELKGTLTVESAFRTYAVETGKLGGILSPLGADNLNEVYLTRHGGETINAVVGHKVVFTDDRNTVYIHDHDVDGYFYDECYYLASSLPEDQAQVIFDQILTLYNPGEK